MAASFSPATSTIEGNRHHHHNRHLGEADDGRDGAGAPDALVVIEDALAHLPDDVGAIFEPEVIAALSALRARDIAAYQRIRQQAKKLNPACSVTALDAATRRESQGSDDEPSTLEELVALARAQCQLHHDADRRAVAVIPIPDRREVWRVQSSGFEDWLRAAFWRMKEAGVTDTTMKAALATLSAAGINDGDGIEVHVRAAR